MALYDTYEVVVFTSDANGGSKDEKVWGGEDDVIAVQAWHNAIAKQDDNKEPFIVTLAYTKE